MKRLALLLALVAPPSWAATYYISPTGTATWANATNPATPASIYTANTQAVAGDLIIAQGGGTYPFRIKPRRSGTSGNPIVYAGAAGSPTAADFPGITLGDSNNSESGPLARGNYVTVKWVRISGSITIDSQALSGGGTNIPTGDSLHAIDHTGGSTTTLKGRLVSYTSSTSTTRQINMFGDGGFFLGPNTISDLQVDGTNTSGGDYQFFRLSKVHGLSITDSRFYVSNAAPSTGYSFFLETYGCRNVDFLRNHVVYRDSSNAGGGSKIYWGHRDSSQFIRIVGNDMDFGGPTPAHFRLSHSGTPVGDCCNRGIRFEHNNVRLRNVASSFAGVLADIGTHADTVRFNLIETWGGTAGFRTQGTVDSLLFAHNTIIHNGQQAVRLQATSTTGARAVANLAYARSANGTADGTSVFYANQNVALDSVGTIFSPGGNSAGGIFRSSSGAGTPGSGGAFGISGKSVWGSPRLMNGASFDSSQGTPAGISETGYADNVKAPNLHDGFSGAFSDSIGGSSGSAPPAPGDSIVALSIVVKDDVAGVVFDYNADADTNATVRVFYGPSTPSDTAHAPARRPGSARTYATSLFGLTPSTPYYLSIVTSDGARKDTTFITRRENWWYREQTGPSVYVSPSGSNLSDGLTTSTPKRTIADSATVAGALTALLARPNQGRGGAIVLMDGIHYQRATITGSAGVPDTGYFIKALNTHSAIIDGAYEPIVNGTSVPTWGAVNAAADPGRVGGAYNTGDTLFATTFAAADSLEGLAEGGYTYYRCTSAADIWDKSGLNGLAQPWDLSTEAHGFIYVNTAADSIYVRARGGVNIRTVTKHFGYRPSLLYIDDPYWQVEGLVFRNSGGLLGFSSGNGIAVRFRATDRANNGTVYNCLFTTNDREGVYAIGSGTGQADSMTVAGNTFTAGFTDRFGYDAGKARREEARQITTLDGAYNTIKNNVARYSFNGIGHGGIAGDYSSMSELDISGNTVSNVSDDAIEAETDAGVNQRIVGNTLSRFGNGISHAPLEVGPYFVIKNLLLYPKAGGGAFKLGGGSNAQGFYYHNTVAVDTTRNSTSWYAAGGTIHNKVFVNNVLTGNGNRGVAGWQAVRNTLTHPDTAGTITNTLNWNVVYAPSDTIAVWRNTVYDTTGWKAIGFEKNGRMRYHPAWQDTVAGNWTAIRGVEGGRRIAGITGVITEVNGTRPDMGYREYVASVVPPATRRQLARFRWWSPWAWVWWMVR